MPSIAIIDLQPLSCLGIKAYLQNLLPASQYQTAYAQETVNDLVLGPELDLVILGLNRENEATTTFLTDKVLTAGQQLPVIVMYEFFDLALLKQLGKQAATGFIAKENAFIELAKCVQTVLSGNIFICEKTSQHVINAFASPATQNRRSFNKKAAPIA
ncbi:response regulator transcription factor [Dyadobacter alkalitolerans]|uniref:response regulator transcription factor n=1 Tax=Dyadobacter alkalitolerans TaxID=492736 RepID=UPI00047DCDA8|nr:response regulator transcription factor [Dyadobacter alkalitolerans]